MRPTGVARAERRSVTAELYIAAGPAKIFDLLTDPALHGRIDGSGTVRGRPQGPTRLGPDDTFSMAMRQGPWSYRSVNRVVEYAAARLIAWESTGTWRGRTVIGGQRWRWALAPQGQGTLVRHSYVWGYARWPILTVRLPGFPVRAARTLPRSLARLRRLAAETF